MTSVWPAIADMTSGDITHWPLGNPGSGWTPEFPVSRVRRLDLNKLRELPGASRQLRLAQRGRDPRDVVRVTAAKVADICQD